MREMLLHAEIVTVVEGLCVSLLLLDCVEQLLAVDVGARLPLAVRETVVEVEGLWV